MDNTGQPGEEDPRVRLAGERTLLAWIRTGLAMMGFGFVVARFGIFLREFSGPLQHTGSASLGLSVWIGTALILLGVVVNVLAAREHVVFLRRLKRGQPYQPPRWSLGVLAALVLATFGIGMTAYLLLVSP